MDTGAGKTGITDSGVMRDHSAGCLGSSGSCTGSFVLSFVLPFWLAGCVLFASFARVTSASTGHHDQDRDQDRDQHL